MKNIISYEVELNHSIIKVGQNSEPQYLFFHFRKQRFEKITKDLKVTRVFSTLVEEMKAIGTVSSDGSGESGCTDVMVPMAHSQRSPVLLLMGGGMGAGKSTVLKDILKQYVIIYFISPTLSNFIYIHI